MIAYRSATRSVATADVLANVDDPLTFLIEFGELEAALADHAIRANHGSGVNGRIVADAGAVMDNGVRMDAGRRRRGLALQMLNDGDESHHVRP